MRSVTTCFHHITANIQFTSAENMQYFVGCVCAFVATGSLISRWLLQIYRELRTPINGQTVEE